MPAIIYRSARVVVQNSSNALWTLDAAEVFCGRWADKYDPAKAVAEIGPQSSGVLESISTALRVGAEGYARFSSVEARMQITWCRPWVGPFEVGVEFRPERFDHAVSYSTANPADGVAMVVLTPCSEGG